MKASAAARAAPSSDVVRCARCGHAISLDAWRGLPRERTLTRADVGAYVSGWPADAVVEVRRCAGCDTPIARRARAS
jgi:hypothetical protein